MQALRDKFNPSTSSSQAFPSTNSSPQPRVSSRDYFTYVPTSPTVRAPSLPSVTPKNAMTPAAVDDHHREPFNGFTRINKTSPEKPPKVGPSTANVINDSAPRRTSNVVRRTSAMRKQVAAGDLAMTSSTISDENGGMYYRPAAQTPGISRMDTWRGRLSGSTIDLREHGGVPMQTSPDEQEESFELREAILMSIAKSIGLAQPTEANVGSIGRASMAPSVSAASTPNSPMFPPGGRNTSRSPFGNVLDMMNASANSENILGGMLREAVINARQDDEMSSVSGSMQERSSWSWVEPERYQPERTSRSGGERRNLVLQEGQRAGQGGSAIARYILRHRWVPRGKLDDE